MDFENDTEEVKGKRPKKIIFLTAFFLLIAIICLCGYIKGNSAKKIYFNLEEKAITSVIGSVKELFSKYTANDTIKQNLLLEIDTEVPLERGTNNNFSIEGILSTIYPAIDGLKINSTSEADYKNNYETSSGELYMMGEKFFYLDCITDKNNIIVGIPELYEKTISIDGNNLESIYNKMGMSESEKQNMPSRVILQNELKEAVKFSKNEEKVIKKSYGTYKNLINKNIPDANFINNKNVLLEYDGKSKKTDMVEVSLTQSELTELKIKLLEQVKKDPSTEIILNKFEKINELYKESGYENYMEDYSKEKLINNIDIMISKLKNSLENETFEGKIVSRLYYKGNQILKRHIFNELKYDEETVQNDIINFTSIINKEDEYYELKEQNFFATTVYKDYVKIEKNKETHEIKIEQIPNENYEYMQSSSQSICKIIIDKSTKNKTIIDVNPVDELNNWGIKITNTKNNKNNTFDLNFNSDFKGNKIDLKLNVASETGIKISKKEIEKSTTFDMNNSSAEEMKEFVDEIKQNFERKIDELSSKNEIIKNIFFAMKQNDELVTGNEILN